MEKKNRKLMGNTKKNQPSKTGNVVLNDTGMTMEDEMNFNESSANETDNESMDIDDEFAGSSESDNDVSSKEGVWANAMSTVLNTAFKSKTFILSKAKKDSEIKKNKPKEVELVDESGNVVPSEDNEGKQKSFKEKRKEMIAKRRQKTEWESMGRVKPDVTNKEKEREFIRIATKGVVHLFNAVQQHQKTITTKKDKRPKKMNVVKGNFMDVLKKCSKDDPVMAKVKQEETWNILKDDFMMGAEMKDWDKDSDVET